MTTYPRCDGTINHIIIRAFCICVVRKLLFRGIHIFEKPIAELEVTTTNENEKCVSAFDLNVYINDTHMPRLGNWHACCMGGFSTEYARRVQQDDIQHVYRSSQA